MRRTRRGWQVLWLGVAVSGVLLYLALREVDWRALGETLAGTRFLPAALCGLAIAAGIAFRGWRWNLIAAQSWRETASFARATNMGVLGNQLLPGRLGEAVRVLALVRMQPVGLSVALGSAVIDRVSDAAVLLLSAWLVSMAVAGGVVPSSWIAGLGLLLSLFVLGLVVVRTRAFQAWLTAWSESWVHRWALRPESFLQTFNGMVWRLVGFRQLPPVVVAMAAVFAADYLAVAAALWSIGLDLPLLAPLLLWVMLAAGSALPSAPGYVGVYQLAAVLALSVYAVPSHQAVAASLILQAVTLVVSILGAGPEIFRLRPGKEGPVVASERE